MKSMHENPSRSQEKQDILIFVVSISGAYRSRVCLNFSLFVT